MNKRSQIIICVAFARIASTYWGSMQKLKGFAMRVGCVPFWQPHSNVARNFRCSQRSPNKKALWQVPTRYSAEKFQVGREPSLAKGASRSGHGDTLYPGGCCPIQYWF